MAAHALSNSAETTPRLAVGRVSDEIYASLLGGAPRVLKKKPVLMLDPDELAQAHLAIAMGGAQILEAANEPTAVARPRTPSLLLGLAPVGAPDDWDPGFTTLAEPEEDWEQPLADIAPAPEADAEPDDDWDDLAAEPEAVEDYAAEIAPEPDVPSIEDQLARMRHLTARPEAPEVAPVVWSEPETEPEPEIFSEQPFAEPEPEPEIFTQPFVAEPEPEPESEPEVFNLSLASALPPAPAPAAASTDYDFDEDDGPDLSWMQPKERRPLVFNESEHSALRAKLVHLEVEADDDFAAPSLWDRVRGWWARLLG